MQDGLEGRVGPCAQEEAAAEVQEMVVSPTEAVGSLLRDPR